MRTRLLLLFFTIQMPISGFAQKAVSAGFGSFQTNCSNQGAYLRLGIDVFDNLELIYTYKGSFGQSWNVSVMLGLKYLRNLLWAINWD